METSIYFDLSPLDQHQKGNLISGLSDGWAYLNGRLFASPKNQAKDQVAWGGHLIFRERQASPLFEDIAQQSTPPLYAILAEHRAPGQVSFIQAGNPMYSGMLAFALARDMAAHYVSLGHTGQLQVFSRDRHAPGPLYTVLIALDHWQDSENRWQPPLIRIDTDPNVTTNSPLIASTLALCYGLRHYDPKAAHITT